MAFVRRQLLQGDQAGAHHLALVDRERRLQRVLDDRLDPGVIGGRKGKGIADHLLLRHDGRSRQSRLSGCVPDAPARARVGRAGAAGLASCSGVITASAAAS